MGCWNGTDALTQYPIFHGDRVRCFILSSGLYHKELGGGFCHPSDMYEPFYLPICGKYDDYGGVEEIEEDINTKAIVSHFNYLKEKKLLIVKREKYCHEKLESKIASIIRYIERGKLAFKETTYQPILGIKKRQMGLMMVLEETYQAAVELAKKEKSWHDQRTFEEVFNEEEKTIKEGFACEDYFERARKLERCDWFRSFQERRWENNLLKGYAEKNINDDSIFFKVKEFMLFSTFMALTRKFYSPQTGAGGQDDNTDLVSKFYKKSIEIVKKREQKRKEDWE